MGSVMTIDEVSLLDRLSRLRPQRRSAFAAACAERALPAFSKYNAATGEGDDAALREALDAVWSAQADSGQDLVSKLKIVEEQIPDEDGFWVFESAYAQNAAASVAYALRSCISGDGQDGMWAARQLLELAELAIQRPRGADLEATGAVTPRDDLCAIVVGGILSDLEAVEAEDMQLSELRARAQEEGRALSLRLP